MIQLAPKGFPPCGHDPIPDKIACPTCEPPEDWREYASCVGTDPEAFYPQVGESSAVGQVMRICQGCPVQPYCLEAGWMDQHGIWGGWTPEARRQHRKKNRNISVTMIRALGTTTRRS